MKSLNDERIDTKVSTGSRKLFDSSVSNGNRRFFPVWSSEKKEVRPTKFEMQRRYVPMSGVEGTLFMLTMVESVATDEVAGDPVADDAATDAVERFKLFMASILFSMMFIFGDAVLPFAG